MPGLAGTLLARRLQERDRELRVLFMSNYARERHSARPIEPALLIPKPFTHDELVASVKAVLDASPTGPHTVGGSDSSRISSVASALDGATAVI